MAGFTDILGTLIQDGLSQSSKKRLSNAFGAGGGGSLNDIVSGIGEMLSTGGKSQAGSLGGMLGDVMESLGSKKAALGGLGALGGALLGGGSSSAKGAIGGGALAMLASLAFSALKSAGQSPPELAKGMLEPESPEQKQELEQEANILVKAMINAAKADGAIDQAELQKIIGKFEEDGLTQDDKDFFMTESTRPLDINGVIASAAGRPDVGAQIYAASLLAIEVDTSAEKRYMENLADGLHLAPATVSFIEQSLAK
jgi:uncharacterized membrane protein YebE (DUF533 family)